MVGSAALNKNPSRRPILWAEDDEAIREVLQVVLARKGFNVSFAENGIKALLLYNEARLKGEPFALVVLDIAMPDLAGHEVAARIRQGERERAAGERVALIYCTAYDASPNRFQAQDNEAIGFLTKPIDFETLPTTLGAALAE